MAKTMKVAAALALISAPSAQAATDSGLQFLGGRSVSGRGVGAEARILIRFGSRKNMARSDRAILSLAAGPVVGRSGARFSVSPLVGFAVRPGYSATLTLSGQDAARMTTRLGAAEDKARGKRPSTLGWVGIGAGVVLGALGAAYLALEDALDCTENGEYVCE
jgi:hypothetical protein